VLEEGRLAWSGPVREAAARGGLSGGGLEESGA
jgi:hypothetical protein